MFALKDTLRSITVGVGSFNLTAWDKVQGDAVAPDTPTAFAYGTSNGDVVYTGTTAVVRT